MTVRVNIRTAANMSGIRRDRINGRDKIIVPSATLPDGVIMNGIQYPADEIEKGYKSLDNTIAPLGHPTIDGQFVSASHPEGINIGWIGAHNANVRRENGRVYLDKIIDVQRANESAGGKAVLAAIEKGDPIHTSTGLLCDLDDASGDGYKHIARNMVFDHDAILLGEAGAATPDQGVGMMVNSKGEPTEIKVINSMLEEADRELDWAVDHLAQALDKRERAPMLERIKAAILEAFTAEREPNNTSTQQENDMDKEQFDALSAKVNSLSENAVTKTDLTNALNDAMKPLIDAHAEIKANQDAKDKADKDALVNKVVDAKIDGFTKEVAETMAVPALNAVLTMSAAKTNKAAPLIPGFANSNPQKQSLSPLANGLK